MAVFVELDDDDVELPPDIPKVWPDASDILRKAATDRIVPVTTWNLATGDGDRVPAPEPSRDNADEKDPAKTRDNPNQNRMTEALGCYPIVMALVVNIDLNTLDSLSQTCRQIRVGLLQYRKMLLASSLRCVNEDKPIDPEDTLRYRARAGNWFYMQDASRTNYSGKSGACARDLVSECRRCGTVVCRNCAIKPPAPIVLRDRHRRLCKACSKAPIGAHVKPRLPDTTPLSAEVTRRLICKCQTEGVWLCQPCGRTIRGDDYDYISIWKWRNQYGEVLGGVGTGIGEGDRGVICGRGSDCCARHDQEQETDCDAEDAREAEGIMLGTSPPSSSSPQPTEPHPWSSRTGAASFTSLNSLQASVGGYGLSPMGLAGVVAADANRRTPSPALGPGYIRHEIEGIGGVVKTKRLKIIKVGACVAEHEDEKTSGEIMSREIKGKARSWCGWCWRVIPGKKDEEAASQAADSSSSTLI